MRRRSDSREPIRVICGLRLTLPNYHTSRRRLLSQLFGRVGSTFVRRRIKCFKRTQIDRYEARGARLTDGTLVPADLVVLATGYLNQETDIRDYFGDAVADRVGKIWGWDEAGELRGAWRPTGQKQLWLQLGGVPQARTYSKLLALQIVAELRGLK